MKCVIKMNVRHEPDNLKINPSHTLKMCNKPIVALEKYWWQTVRSDVYGNKNRLQFALQACVLMDDFCASMEPEYAVTLVPSIRVGMLDKGWGCRWSLPEPWDPENLRASQSNRFSSLCCALCFPDVTGVSRAFVLPQTVVSAETQAVKPASCRKRLVHQWKTGWEKPSERLEGGQRPESPPSICVPVSSLSHSAKQKREGSFIFFHAVYSNAQRVKFFLEPRV